MRDRDWGFGAGGTLQGALCRGEINLPITHYPLPITHSPIPNPLILLLKMFVFPPTLVAVDS
jgi:hypothetical protein